MRTYFSSHKFLLRHDPDAAEPARQDGHSFDEFPFFGRRGWFFSSPRLNFLLLLLGDLSRLNQPGRPESLPPPGLFVAPPCLILLLLGRARFLLAYSDSLITGAPPVALPF